MRTKFTDQDDDRFELFTCGDVVSLIATSGSGTDIVAVHLRPKRARKAARSLRRLADEVEGVTAASTTKVTEAQLADAFTEWDRRYREEPERFESEAVHLIHGDPETYGEACAPYLLAIIEEQRP